MVKLYALIWNWSHKSLRTLLKHAFWGLGSLSVVLASKGETEERLESRLNRERGKFNAIFLNRPPSVPLNCYERSELFRSLPQKWLRSRGEKKELRGSIHHLASPPPVGSHFYRSVDPLTERAAAVVLGWFPNFANRESWYMSAKVENVIIHEWERT